MIQLLEASQQNVDPNLRALVVVKKPTAKNPAAKNNHEEHEAENDSFDDDANDPFLQQLSPRRIVLARASNISDASSDSSSCDESLNEWR